MKISEVIPQIKGQEKTYNKIANWLKNTFGESSAELILLLTYYELNRKEILKIKELSYEECEDFQKVIDIVFDDLYPEYKEDRLIELLEPYVLNRSK